MSKIRKKTQSIVTLLWVVLAFLLFPGMLPAEESPSVLHIATPSWEGQTEEDGTGFFFEIIRTIYEPRGVRVTWEFANWERSMDLVKRGYADAMPSVWREDAEEAGLKVPNFPLYLEYTAAVFKKKTFPEWNGIRSLQNRSVVWFKGYNYHQKKPFADISMRWMELPSESNPWRMLDADRMDALIDAAVDVDNHVETHLVDMVVYRVVNLWGQKAYLAFSNTPASLKLMAIFDEGMAALLTSGDLAKLHEKWHVRGFDPSAWKTEGELLVPVP